MKKNIFLIISYICIILLTSLKVSYASTTGTVYLSTNKMIIEKNEEVEITLLIEDTKTSAFTSYLYFDDEKFEYISGPENTNVIENRIIFVWYDETGEKGAKSGELAKFKFKAKEDGLSTFTINGEFYNDVGQLIQTNFKELQIEIGRNNNMITKEEEIGSNTEKGNANLQSLRLDIEGITPTFNKDIKEYYLTVSDSVNNIDVLAVSENPNSTIEITGNTNLKDGLNTININVISEDKTQKNVYSIQVTKTDDIESANTNLETLAIENDLLKYVFDSTITNYNIEVSNKINNLNVFAAPEDENAKVQIEGKDNLKEGSNLLKITVTAQNGYSKKVYKVNVYKRNSEEENSYEQEQEENKQKLEENIEEIKNEEKSQDNQTEEKIEQKAEKSKYKILWVVIIVILVIIIIALVIRAKKDRFLIGIASLHYFFSKGPYLFAKRYGPFEKKS